MSVSLATVDLTGASVGTQKIIDFNQYAKVDPAQPFDILGHLGIYNDSGCGLQYLMQNSNRSGYIPAGGWQPLELARNDGQCQLTVIYTLPNPPVSTVMPTYYEPGETVPPAPILGNSPVGIGGSVSTTSIQTLSNENNPPTPVLVIDIGNTTVTQLITINNDGSFVWSVLSGGVAHQILKGQTSGNFLQLGKASDTVEVLSNLLLDAPMAIGSSINTNIMGIFRALADANKALVVIAHSATQSGDLFAAQDSGFNNLVRITSNGSLLLTGGILSLTPPAIGSSLSTGGTLATAGLGMSDFALTANVTGCILQAGTVNGQVVLAVNTSTSFSATFANTPGSNIATSGVVIPAAESALFIWRTQSSLWYLASHS